MKGHSILVVEDDAIIALDIRIRLQNLEYGIVDYASSGQEALKLFEQNHYDLVLMDVHLGEQMDGVDTALAMIQKRIVPVIFVTAFAGDTTVDSFKQLPIAFHIAKPFDFTELVDTIDVALFPDVDKVDSQCSVDAGDSSVEFDPVYWPERAIMSIKVGQNITPLGIEQHYRWLTATQHDSRYKTCTVIIYDFCDIEDNPPFGAIISAAQRSRKGLIESVTRNLLIIFVANSSYKTSLLQVWLRLTNRRHSTKKICHTMEDALAEAKSWQSGLH